MMGKYGAALVLVLTAVAAALGAYNLVVWESPGQGSYSADPNYKRVIILRAGTFKIAAYENGQPAEISRITVDIVDPNYAGAVTVNVIPDPNDPNFPATYGASYLAEINLTGSNAVGTIGELAIQYDLADDADVEADEFAGPVTAQDILHDILVDRLRGNIVCDTMKSLIETGTEPNEPPSPLPNVTIHGDQAYGESIECWYLDTLTVRTVEGTSPQGLMGDVLVRKDAKLVSVLYGDIWGTVEIGGSLLGSDQNDVSLLVPHGGLRGTVAVTDDVLGSGQVGQIGGYPAGPGFGQLVVGDELSGWLRCQGRIAELAGITIGSLTGTLTIEEDATGWDVAGSISVDELKAGSSLEFWYPTSLDPNGVLYVGALRGRVLVEGDVYGAITIDAIEAPEDSVCDGHLQLSGSLREGALIYIGEYSGAGGYEYVAVNYDGLYPDVDVWEENASIWIDSTEYTESDPGNTPAERVWKISACKGDMNNDIKDSTDPNETPNFDDVAPFVLALSDPNSYALEAPGLDGSRVYHGDCNDDGYFDYDDIDPFIDLPDQPCSMYGDGFQLQYTAAELAHGILGHVPPDQLWLVQSLAVTMADQSTVRPDYWQDVYEYLTQ